MGKHYFKKLAVATVALATLGATMSLSSGTVMAAKGIMVSIGLVIKELMVSLVIQTISLLLFKWVVLLLVGIFMISGLMDHR
jgi:hypothetical protein